MISLFPVPDEQQEPMERQLEIADPRTSFREVQLQDVVIWSSSIFDDNKSKVFSQTTPDPKAVEWFLSPATDQLSFLSVCSMFGLDPDPIRSAVQAKINKPKGNSREQ